jgi:hypothetical protein
MFWSFLLGFIGIALLARLAVARGEVRYDCTADQLRRLSRRGRVLMAAVWPFVAAFLLALFPNVPSRNVFSDLVLIVAAVLPAALLAFLLNIVLERTPFRIRTGRPG